MKQFTHKASFSLILTPSAVYEELAGFAQSIGVEYTDDGRTLCLQAYSQKAIDEMATFLQSEPYAISITKPKRPCVYLGRQDMLLPAIFTCMPQFDEVIFHADEDGMYAYATLGTLSRVFGSLKIIDESQPDDEEV